MPYEHLKLQKYLFLMYLEVNILMVKTKKTEFKKIFQRKFHRNKTSDIGSDDVSDREKHLCK